MRRTLASGIAPAFIALPPSDTPAGAALAEIDAAVRAIAPAGTVAGSD
ncbi:hypothetical protein [Pseudonocardia sp. TRM90224]|nr:hypothetical protein [Pseudonocardia sp. TRM90224]